MLCPIILMWSTFSYVQVSIYPAACNLNKCAYVPSRAISASCVPSSIILPCLIAMIRSAILTVEKRWAISKVVAPAAICWSRPKISDSDSASIDDVGSSNTRKLLACVVKGFSCASLRESPFSFLALPLHEVNQNILCIVCLRLADIYKKLEGT